MSFSAAAWASGPAPQSSLSMIRIGYLSTGSRHRRHSSRRYTAMITALTSSHAAASTAKSPTVPSIGVT